MNGKNVVQDYLLFDAKTLNGLHFTTVCLLIRGHMLGNNRSLDFKLSLSMFLRFHKRDKRAARRADMNSS
jgi:hypothetical protein